MLETTRPVKMQKLHTYKTKKTKNANSGKLQVKGKLRRFEESILKA